MPKTSEFSSSKSSACKLVQRYIVRIIFMVPLYASMSFLSLLMPHNSIYFDSVRDWQAPFPPNSPTSVLPV